jgi:solute carrier family 8 (sodium/calcium exchanger)
VSEKNGFVTITIMNKTNKEVNVNLRTEDGQALAGKDYEAKDMILTLKPLERERHINIPVKNDAEWAPDKDFMVLICDESGEKLIGDDCEAKVTILEDDKPGILGFEERQINVSRKQSKVSVKIIRTDGSDGKAKVTIKTIKADEDMVEGKPAAADKDYVPFQTQVVLESNVIEYVQDIELPDCENDTTDVYSFAVVLEDPVPAGVKLSKRATCYINIEPAEGNAEIQAENQERDKMLDYFLNNQDPPYSSHFKNACILGPSIDDNNLMDDVTCGEAIMHLLTIFWKCLFAIIPPKNMWGGWAAFLVALSLIGVITVLVGEVATVLGCSIGLKPSVTGITLVAMGTSLPDTFASKTPAQGSQYADSAIGNVTGSNSVNVFLGVGLPWVIGAMYW